MINNNDSSDDKDKDVKDNQAMSSSPIAPSPPTGPQRSKYRLPMDGPIPQAKQLPS